MTESKLLLCVTILLYSMVVDATLEVFDVDKVEANSDLVSIDVSQPPTNPSTASMPNDLVASFQCRGKQIGLALTHYPYRTPSSPYTDTVNSRYGFQFNIGDGIPVFTHQLQQGVGRNGTRVIADTFPRLFAHSCRAYRDPRHQAALVGIRDPQFQSIKFFGSFFMDGIHFFLQPLALSVEVDYGVGKNSSRGRRLHVMEEVPGLDFSDDGVHVAQTERAKSYSAGIYNDLLNPKISGPANKLLRRNRPSRERPDGQDSPSHGNARLQRRLGRERKNRSRLQGRRTKLNGRRQRPGSSRIPQPDAFDFSRRKKRFPGDDYTVEVFLVCDFLCYQRFQSLYGVTDPILTKSAIAEFFAYVRTFYETAYSDLRVTYPELGLSIEVRVVGLYIATDVADKIIGDYVIGDNDQVEAKSSAFEFALWVEDSLKVSLRADHYALVTGYDLSGTSSGILGLVSNIPSVCDIDRVSVNELRLPTVATVMAHELGHSLGAQHDGITDGFCRDDQQFLMTTFLGGGLPPENVGNSFRFSRCSAQYFQAALPNRTCLRRDDFEGSPLPSDAPFVGQQFPLDQQCDGLFKGSLACRKEITLAPGSWTGICSNALCLFPGSTDLCFAIRPLEFTSCGNGQWCRRGVCVESIDALEKPVDCPAGDKSTIDCDITACARSYDDVTRFINCCDTCRPLKTERFVTFSNTEILAQTHDMI